MLHYKQVLHRLKVSCALMSHKMESQRLRRECMRVRAREGGGGQEMKSAQVRSA